MRAARAAAILKKAGYDVVGACGLRDAKSKGLELIYPSKDAAAKDAAAKDAAAKDAAKDGAAKK